MIYCVTIYFSDVLLALYMWTFAFIIGTLHLALLVFLRSHLIFFSYLFLNVFHVEKMYLFFYVKDLFILGLICGLFGDFLKYSSWQGAMIA